MVLGTNAFRLLLTSGNCLCHANKDERGTRIILSMGSNDILRSPHSLRASFELVVATIRMDIYYARRYSTVYPLNSSLFNSFNMISQLRHCTLRLLLASPILSAAISLDVDDDSKQAFRFTHLFSKLTCLSIHQERCEDYSNRPVELLRR